MKLANKLKEVFDNVFPKYDFWSNFVQKFLSFLVSFKVYVVVLASFFRAYNLIDGGTWATTIVSITLGRVVVQGVLASKKMKDPDEISPPEEYKGE